MWNPVCVRNPIHLYETGRSAQHMILSLSSSVWKIFYVAATNITRQSPANTAIGSWDAAFKSAHMSHFLDCRNRGFDAIAVFLRSTGFIYRRLRHKLHKASSIIGWNGDSAQKSRPIFRHDGWADRSDKLPFAIAATERKPRPFPIRTLMLIINPLGMAPIAPNLLRIEILVKNCSNEAEICQGSAQRLGRQPVCACWIIRKDMGRENIRRNLRLILPGK
jgi:hypothetical protein